MNPLQAIFARITENKHTSYAALAYIIGTALVYFGSIWMPGHADQWKATGEAIEKLAVTYGLLLSGTPKPPPPTEP